MADNVLVQVNYVMEKEGRVFQDALYFPIADYPDISPETIEAMKQERFDNWYAIATEQNPPAEEGV